MSDDINEALGIETGSNGQSDAKGRQPTRDSVTITANCKSESKGKQPTPDSAATMVDKLPWIGQVAVYARRWVPTVGVLCIGWLFYYGYNNSEKTEIVRELTCFGLTDLGSRIFFYGSWLTASCAGSILWGILWVIAKNTTKENIIRILKFTWVCCIISLLCYFAFTLGGKAGERNSRSAYSPRYSW